ncbi:methionine--tRNA ligase [bacterium]|nr:methionine--tRNA ligase [candidate division CSSED10-310 bacterium]
MAPRYYTTPIYYVNGDPHIGHAHTTVMGDILKRLNLMRGDDTFYSTGTDEHGQKNQEAIEKSGMDAEIYLSKLSDRFRELFDRLNIQYDCYIRTTFESHKTVVTKVLAHLHEKALIYKKDYTGLYCVGCEQFKKESDLDGHGNCPDHQRPPIKQTETNYFFKISLFQDWLKKWLMSDDNLIQPLFYRNEVLAMLVEPLEDLCISRPKSRVWLGIELPFDTDYVTYVWFDALLNYITNVGYGISSDFDKWWNNSIHLMAKDIIKTHIIYWPIMLKAIDVAPPSRFRIHGYWVGEGGQKMAKSLGNVIEPNDMIDLVGPDGFRFYLAKSMGGTDAQISKALVLSTYNTDLANNLGNLHSRVVKFVDKRFAGRVPPKTRTFPEDRALQEYVAEKANETVMNCDLISIPNLIATSLEIADRLNLYFNDAAPWKMVKIEEEKERVHSVLYAMLDCLRMLFELLTPVIPETASKALVSLGSKPVGVAAARHTFLPDGLRQHATFGEIVDLFPRIDN